jgi:uncharacterized protein (UPF0548 family)
MLTVGRPSDRAIREFVDRQQTATFSYAEVGGTRSMPPRSYTIDRNRVRLGAGGRAFDAGVAALQQWQMFNTGWLTLCWPTAPIDPGTTVGILAPLMIGLWSLNACRIVYTFDEDAELRRYGFAYGTLADHMETGEERFAIEWHREDDSVWYDILAFSRPRHLLARLGKPFSRALQRRFARDSMAAMTRAVRHNG